MSTTESVAQTGQQATTPSSPKKMRKVALASFMGTVIEFYEFGIYGTAAALVFAHVFFPALGEGAGTIVSFVTLGVAFVARPIGSIIFGHFGDRIGRKKTLLVTMLLMGICTFIMGTLPTAAAIGVMAPIILIVLRVGQGIAAGGEWAGAALFTSEHAPKESRGFWASFTNFGGAVANILALVTFLITTLSMTDAQFENWGWRIPFLASVILLIFGLWVRLQMEDTPVFKAQTGEAEPVRFPFKDALASQWREIFLASGALSFAFAFGYMGITYLTNYGTATLGLSYVTVLGAGILGNVINGVSMLCAAALSDRIGRRKVLLIAAVASIPWGLVLFPLLDLQTAGAFWLGVGLTFIIGGFGFGIAGSFLSELFPTRYRYTAAGLGYNFSTILGAALPPIIASAVIPAFGSMVFGVILALYGVVSVICILTFKETRHVNLDEESETMANRT
ncbi:MFS transporter [Corynebacterium glyciniphilum]|uniref:MFS transporter n=1 Tax=Corynebacterium glyciniphilum TaxID=1404244 RepID=UPI003DA1148B